MLKPASTTSKPFSARTEPVVLPDVATEAHPIVTVPSEPAIEELAPVPAVDASEDAPVGDYVRQIQMEFEEQEDEGKI
jgi:hypothetical protein